jgi:hypothetical protein
MIDSSKVQTFQSEVKLIRACSKEGRSDFRVHPGNAALWVERVADRRRRVINVWATPLLALDNDTESRNLNRQCWMVGTEEANWP